MGVRLATIDDIKTMSFIHAQTWKSAYIDYICAEYLDNISDEGWIPLFTKALVKNLHEAAVFELDDKITGTVTFGQGRPMTSCTTGNLCSTNDGTKPDSSFCNDSLCSEGEIISLYVLPQHWSTKQGYELTKYATQRLKNQGYKSCYLWVIKDNERAVNFYKRFGYESTNELTTVLLAGQPVVEEKYRIYL